MLRWLSAITKPNVSSFPAKLTESEVHLCLLRYIALVPWIRLSLKVSQCQLCFQWLLSELHSDLSSGSCYMLLTNTHAQTMIGLLLFCGIRLLAGSYRFPLLPLDNQSPFHPKPSSHTGSCVCEGRCVLYRESGGKHSLSVNVCWKWKHVQVCICVCVELLTRESKDCSAGFGSAARGACLTVMKCLGFTSSLQEVFSRSQRINLRGRHLS